MGNSNKDLGEISIKIDASDLRGIVGGGGGGGSGGGKGGGGRVPTEDPASPMSASQRATKALRTMTDAARRPQAAFSRIMNSLSVPRPQVSVPPVVGGAAAAAGEAGAGAAGAAAGGAARIGGAVMGGAGMAAGVAGGPIGIAVAAIVLLGVAATGAGKAIGKIVSIVEAIDAKTSADIQQYRKYSGALAGAAAMQDVTRTLTDLRSSAARGPALAFASKGESARDTAIARLGDMIRPIQYILTGAVNEGIAKVVNGIASLIQFLGGIIKIVEAVALALAQYLQYLPFVGQIGKTLEVTLPLIMANLATIARAVAPTDFNQANAWALADIDVMTTMIPRPSTKGMTPAQLLKHRRTVY